MKTDVLIVGAGFTGAVLAERIASQLNLRVVVLDRRDHIGGNAFDYYDENGILVHRYGPHIFHTNSRKIWDYLSLFTSWTPYYHRVLASVEGIQVPVPFNLNSIAAVFPGAMAERLERRLIERFGFGVKVPILKMLDETEGDLKELAQYVYRNVFDGYTQKQWGLKPEELDASVTGRVPVYVSRDDRYFQDTCQAIPSQGYSQMFRRMLSHPNIRILLKTGYREAMDDIQFDRMVFTGPIDEYFSYLYGELPYRSLRFEFKYKQGDTSQMAAQLNYPNEHDFTRTTEFRQITGQRAEGSTVAYEYPEPHIRGANDPYYPIPREANRQLFQLYEQKGRREDSRVIFAGRLADYKYYNMDQAVGRALKVFEEQILRCAPVREASAHA